MSTIIHNILHEFSIGEGKICHREKDFRLKRKEWKVDAYRVLMIIKNFNKTRKGNKDKRMYVELRESNYSIWISKKTSGNSGKKIVETQLKNIRILYLELGSKKER